MANFPNVTLQRVHSPEMVTVDTDLKGEEQLKAALSADYHVEPEITRGLT